jgi:hypothetical protein
MAQDTICLLPFKLYLKMKKNMRRDKNQLSGNSRISYPSVGTPTKGGPDTHQVGIISLGLKNNIAYLIPYTGA